MIETTIDTIGRRWTIITEAAVVGFRWTVYVQPIGSAIDPRSLEMVYPGGIAHGWAEAHHTQENAGLWLATIAALFCKDAGVALLDGVSPPKEPAPGS